MTETTPDLSPRAVRALAAATEAGRALGLTVTEPVVLHDVFSTVVHLSPSPVVVRVPTVIPVDNDPDEQARQQQRELDVTQWLDAHGCPVVTPSALVPATPIQRDGYSMTLWTWVDHQPVAEPDYVGDTALVADLHEAMRGYDGELRYLPFLGDIPDSLAFLRANPELIDKADLARATREWEVLAPVVSTRAAFTKAFPDAEVRPVHGDSPGYNLIRTPEGVLFSDFELVCLAPVEWDLTQVGPEAVAAYDARAASLGLPGADVHLLRVLEAVRMLQVVACLALVPQLPILAEGLRGPLEQWRGMDFAGGLA